ncbi:MAG: rhamnulokinase [Tepidisphaera sp.]
MATTVHLAIDLGAESGRAVVGVLSDGVLETAEVHRFAHAPRSVSGGLFWDLDLLWREIRAGLAAAGAWCKGRGVSLATVGVDTWGVDYALVDAAGELLESPRCYRDPRNAAAYERVLAEVGEETIYAATGIQFMALNTLYQLAATKQETPDLLRRASRLLFMPDLFHFMLTGEMKTERSIASTSQMLDPTTGTWATSLLERCGIPGRILGEPVDAGTVVGAVKRSVLDEAGVAGPVLVVTPAAHDTASAVAAVPAGPGPWAYLSSGTWSLMGVELSTPILSEQARRAPFTNELGVGRSVRFLKNIAGLWLLQETRRDLAELGESKDYAELAREAEASPAFRTLIDPDRAEFAAPGGMIGKIQAFARATGQPEPRTSGELARSCVDSLALAYGRVGEKLRAVTGTTPETLHVVGGGGRNALLNQLTADATGMNVAVGPYEATSTGNLLIQAMGVGAVGGIGELRRISARACSVQHVRPSENDAARDAARRYAELTP